MVKVTTAKTAGLTAPDGKTVFLPREFCAVLPNKCNACGAELEITETLTQLVCPNPRCLTKVVQRAVDMLSSLGILGMGESKCHDFFSKVKVTSPYALFALSEKEIAKYNLTEIFSEKFLKDIMEQLAKRRTMTLAEFVRIGFLPGIQDNAYKLFTNYNSMTAFYTDLDEQGINLIADLLGTASTSVSATTIFTTLQMYRQDLLTGEKYVIIQQGVNEVNICLSTKVGGQFKSKDEFVHYINDTYGDRVHINKLSSVTKKGCDYLICADKSAGTSKVNNATKYNVPIVSAEEFEELIKSGKI